MVSEPERSVMIMNRLLEFDYFYGAEADQFSFIRLPKLLFTDRHFRSLSLEAKTVYGIMLDRMSLSVKNNWIDEENRVYITYSITSLAEEIGCSKDRVGRILSELDDVKGIGLVERKRRGLGKPDIIYVKNFVKVIEKLDGDEVDGMVDKSSSIKLSTMTEVPGTLENTQKTENQDSRNRNLPFQETGKTDFKKPENPVSGNRNMPFQEAGNSGTNNTNINNTEYNDTDLIESLSFDKPIRLSWAKAPPEEKRKDGMDEDPLIRRIKENIQYDWHMEHDSISDKGSWQNYFEIIKGMVIGEREKVRIGEATYPYSFVRERFLSLTDQHIYYAQLCVERDKNKIYNMKAYMTTTLFHAPETMDEYYRQLHTYNTEGDGWNERKSG